MVHVQVQLYDGRIREAMFFERDEKFICALYIFADPVLTKEGTASVITHCLDTNCARLGVDKDPVSTELYNLLRTASVEPYVWVHQEEVQNDRDYWFDLVDKTLDRWGGWKDPHNSMPVVFRDVVPEERVQEAHADTVEIVPNEEKPDVKRLSLSI